MTAGVSRTGRLGRVACRPGETRRVGPTGRSRFGARAGKRKEAGRKARQEEEVEAERVVDIGQGK